MKFSVAYEVAVGSRVIRLSGSAPTYPAAMNMLDEFRKRNPEPAADILSEENVRRFVLPVLKGLKR